MDGSREVMLKTIHVCRHLVATDVTRSDGVCVCACVCEGVVPDIKCRFAAWK